MQELDRETMKEVEKLRQTYKQAIQELETDLKTERNTISELSKMVEPLIKKRMRKLGQKVARAGGPVVILSTKRSGEMYVWFLAMPNPLKFG